jgi:SAM-dependent methyltransferase
MVKQTRIGSVAIVISNLLLRVVRRIRDIPSRGFPRPGRQDSFDKVRGTNTSGVVWLTCPQSTNFTGGIRYEPCQELLCEWAIEHADISPEEFCFVDIGCGKGRALIIASQYHFKEIIGVEYSASLSRLAEKNLKRCGIHNYRIACMDATEFTYPSVNTFAFFYHPFGDISLLNTVLNRILEATMGQKLVIAYLGQGRHSVARHGGLMAYRATSDLTLFRRAHAAAS